MNNKSNTYFTYIKTNTHIISSYLHSLYFFIGILVVIFCANNTFAKIITKTNLTVTKVIDGDTIWVKENNGKSYKIRFLGINAPEMCTIPIEPYALEATHLVKTLLNNQKIYITYNSKQPKDKYNRLLADIYREKDNLWINHLLVKEGLAYVYIIGSNITHIDKLIETENIAIQNKINIWSNRNYIPITPEDSYKFINEYKIVVGKIERVVKTKNSTWIEFYNNTKYESNLNLKNWLNISQIDNKLLANQYNKKVFSVRVHNNSQFVKYPLKKLEGKWVVIRGYINQTNKNFPPFINLISLQTLNILNNP